MKRVWYVLEVVAGRCTVEQSGDVVTVEVMFGEQQLLDVRCMEEVSDADNV